MAKTCAWCRAVLRPPDEAMGAKTVPMGRGLCARCHEDLQSALAANGLKPSDDARAGGGENETTEPNGAQS